MAKIRSFDDGIIINPPPSPDPNPPQRISLITQILRQLAQLKKDLAALEKLVKELPSQGPVKKAPRKK